MSTCNTTTGSPPTETTKGSGSRGLTISKKLGYVVTNFGLEFAASVWGLFCIHFMTDVAGLSAAKAGWVNMLYRWWDALNDPIVAQMSDHTHHRMGRRRPYMMYMAVPYGILWFINWFVPSSSQWALFWWFLLIQLGSDLAFTCINVPHLALLNDLTDDYKERFQVNTLRIVASVCGQVTSFVMVAILTSLITNVSRRFQVIGLFVCVVIIVCVETSVYCTAGAAHSQPPVEQTPAHSMWILNSLITMGRSMKLLLSVQEYRVTLGIYVLSSVCMQLSLVMVPYFLQKFMWLPMIETVKISIITLVFALIAAVTILRLLKRVDKRTLYFASASAWVLFYILGFFLVGRTNYWTVLFLIPLLGTGTAATFLIPFSMLNDSADYVELHTGKRMDALAFGLAHASQKFTLGCAVFIFETVLAVNGYSPNDYHNAEDVPVRVLWAIKLMFTLFPLGLLTTALVVNIFNRISAVSHEAVLQQLKHDSEKGSLQGRSIGSPPFITYFLLDGVRSDIFSQELDAGNLPNLRELIHSGTFVRNGITAVPSITGYAFIPHITGQDAAASGVLGLRWFNRQLAIGNVRSYVGKTNVNMDLDLSNRLVTVFEHHVNQHSTTFQSYMTRGAEVINHFGWPVTTAKYIGHHWLFNILSKIPFVCKNWFSYESFIIDEAIKDLAQQPKVQWITLASPDGVVHMEGVTKKYRDLLVHLDTEIGRYRKASKQLGQEESRIYCVISDHGMSDVHHNIEVTSELQAHYSFRAFRCTPSTNILSSNLDTPCAFYNNFDVINCINGNLMSFLYFKHPTLGWRHSPEYQHLLAYPAPNGELVNLPEVFLKTPGIRFVLLRASSPLTVLLLSIHGKAELSSPDGISFSYTVESEDPLQEGTKPYPLSNTGLHHIREWLASTYDSAFPLAPCRLWRLFFNSYAQTGDIVLVASDLYDFGENYEVFTGNYRGGHGGISHEQLCVPFILSGPGVKPGVVLDTALAEDVGQTVLHLLGCTINSNPEAGVVLSPALEHN
ncbi:Type I phosphodiesterase / nucleotide pyrophosphatase [Pelomyxa schiedti]|nr:Type I phosphodiesterase / nucleotide pyrophosphatase [Pelomyxa schiedti]